MVKISVYDRPPQVVIQLHLQLSESRVDQLARIWQQIKNVAKYPIVVDLSSVSYISSSGFQLLKRMYEEGAKLVVDGPLPFPYPQTT